MVTIEQNVNAEAIAKAAVKTEEANVLVEVFEKEEVAVEAAAPAVSPAEAGIQKLKQIGNELEMSFYEREAEIRSLMLALAAGKHVLLLGAPGTGKSNLTEEFAKHIVDTEYFQWLLNKSSDPSELLGPLSMKGLKNDQFMRIPNGKLPTAHIAFIDEVYKGNSATLNSLLSIMNEGVWYNDGKKEPVNLKVLIGASNEMPDSGDGLHAFHDRFVLRHWVEYIQDAKNQFDMMKRSADLRSGALQPTHTLISLAEIEAIQEAVKYITVSDLSLNALQKLVYELKTKNGFNISDRRLNACVHLMQASAFLDGRTQTEPDDMEQLAFVLWEKKEDIEDLQDLILKFMDPFKDKINKIYKRAVALRDETLALKDKTDRANKAVDTRSFLEKMANQMEKHIEDARKEGRNVAPFVERLNDIKAMTSQIVDECLLNINSMMSSDELPF